MDYDFALMKCWTLFLITAAIAVGTLACSSSASAAGAGAISGAVASNDMKSLSFSFSIATAGCQGDPCRWFPVVMAQPENTPCNDGEFLDADPATQQAWVGFQNYYVDGPREAIVSRHTVAPGLTGTRLCLIAVGTRYVQAPPSSKHCLVIPGCPLVPVDLFETLGTALVSVESPPPSASMPIGVPGAVPGPAKCRKAGFRKKKVGRQERCVKKRRHHNPKRA